MVEGEFGNYEVEVMSMEAIFPQIQNLFGQVYEYPLCI